MFLPRKRTDGADPRELAEKLEAFKEQCECFRTSSRELLFLMKAFSLDIPEIDSDGFRSRIDRLIKVVESETAIKDCRRALHTDKAYILGFIDREKAYLQEKDSELKSIIEFLRNSLTEMIGESQDFSGRVQNHSVQVERVAGLDDIRKIKEGLKAEVVQMRQAIRAKERSDERRLTALSKEVGTLKSDLESAVEAATTDRLTGLRNRLSFDSYITARVERFAIGNGRFSILMCDIDDFKKVNDTYGHQVGDSVLKAFSSECSSTVRPDDLVARYGGEEFVIVMQGTSLRPATARAQKICSRLSASEYLVPGSNRMIKFTVSIGVAEIRKGDTAETLIGRADRALYAAKQAGKNRALSERNIPQPQQSRAAA